MCVCGCVAHLAKKKCAVLFHPSTFGQQRNALNTSPSELSRFGVSQSRDLQEIVLFFKTGSSNLTFLLNLLHNSWYYVNNSLLNTHSKKASCLKINPLLNYSTKISVFKFKKPWSFLFTSNLLGNSHLRSHHIKGAKQKLQYKMGNWLGFGIWSSKDQYL